MTHFKAHLVAQGFSQWEGINYSEMFAPVVKSAYLNGVLLEDIYMWQPKGYEEKGSERKIAKLWKGLYGLKQAGQEWYTMLHDFLVQLGFY